MRKTKGMIFLLAIAIVISGCAETLRLGLMAAGSTHLQAIGEIPKTKPYNEFFKQVSTAGSNSGLTIISASKDAGILSMERLQYDQVMRFTANISEKAEKYIIELTIDFKKHTTKGTLQKNAIVIFSNLQEVAGINSEDISVSIEDKSLNLTAWKKDVGIK